jgi:hypothetical protein
VLNGQEVLDVVRRVAAEIREETRRSPRATRMFRLWPEPGAAAYRAMLRASQRAGASA